MTPSTHNLRKLGLAAALLLSLATLCGCDLYNTAGLWPLDFYSGYYSYPAYGLYDPTSTIQSVVEYRQDVMDWSANAWSEYILE